MIKAAHLTKIYGDRIAAKDISFEIPDGKICGFLGPNGAGKSTTMNIITGYMAPNSGTVLFDDINMHTNPEKAKRMVGYLPEVPPLYFDMTVTEYLKFVIELKGIKKADRASELERVIVKTGLSLMKTRLVKNLSKGYKQRVGLASALVGNPKFLILDEPSNGLDPKQIVEIRNLIEELGKDHTIVLSTHILSEVSAICNHIIIISHGRLLASDSPEGLEEKFNKNQQIDLVVKANASNVETALDSLENTDSYNVISENDGVTHVKIKAVEGTDIREELYNLFSSKNMPILEQKVDYASLESVYLKLTSEEYYSELLEKEGVTDAIDYDMSEDDD